LDQHAAKRGVIVARQGSQSSSVTRRGLFSSGSWFSGAITIDSDSGRCGDNGASHVLTSTAGPNGAIDWLNCRIDNDGGWSPPYVGVKDLIAMDLSDALKDDNSPFQACEPYMWAFEQYAGQYNVPAILVASFALQESSCNPSAVGGAGEQGLMQLTSDHCNGAPSAGCQDVGFNVQTGAKLFSDLLDQNNGNVLVAIGSYNGWASNMTYSQATSAGNGNCCRCQNNLDYLFQFLNGWLLNVDAYTFQPRLGKYFNLDKCGNNS